MTRRSANLFLLLLIAVMGLAVWVSPEPEHRYPAPGAGRLTPLQAGEIARIRIQNANSPGYTLERDHQGWNMTEPHALPANGQRVEMLLGLLSTTAYERFIVSAEQMGEFGLSPPAVRVWFDDLELSLGGTHPFNGKRYIGMGDTVQVIKDIFVHHLQAGPEEFLSPNLLRPDTRILAIETSDWQLRREAGSEGPWSLQPPGENLSMDLLVQKVDDWRLAQAVRVYPVAAAPVPGPVSVSVLIQTESGTQEYTVLPGPGPALVSRENGLAYQIPALPDLLAAPRGGAH